MSRFTDRLLFLTKSSIRFSDYQVVLTNGDRSWEDGSRNGWAHDKVVRPTLGVDRKGVSIEAASSPLVQ